MKQPTTVPNELKPLNYKQLASMYDVTHKTLKSWMEPFMNEIGKMRGRAFTLKQVQTIFDKLGAPKGSPD